MVHQSVVKRLSQQAFKGSSCLEVGSQIGDTLQENQSVYDKYFIGINEKFCSAGAWFMRHYFP